MHCVCRRFGVFCGKTREKAWFAGVWVEHWRMSIPRYDVVFRGRVRNGMTLDQVRENLSGIFKNDSGKIEKFLSQPPVIIKRGADSETALKLIELFGNAGVECEMTLAGDGSGGEGGVSTEAGGAASRAEAHQVAVCPKCGFEQRAASECVRCGIVFSKFSGAPTDGGGLAPVEAPRITIDKSVEGEGKRVWLLLLLLLLVAFGAYRFWTSSDVRYPPGVLVASDPQQVNIEEPRAWMKGKKVFVPLARFSLRARVLGKERYRFDRGADICPVDLVLGWGPMSDQSILDTLDIMQHYRRFVMTPLSGAPPVPFSVLMAHCANMHMIPANDEIEDRLKAVRAGEIVELRGYLVGIQEGGQWTWVSSLTRNDTGDGSCEVIWVEQLRVLSLAGPSENVTRWDDRARHSGMLLAGIQARVTQDCCVAGFRLKACRNDELGLAP
jgi:hypothetical protein